MLNKVILMGRLTADPELKSTPNGTAVTSFALAVSRGYHRQGEEPQTDFIDVVAWRQTAEFAAKYFSKGQQIALSGRIQTRSYEDRQGNKRKAVEVVAEELFFAEPKRDDRPRRQTPPDADEEFIELEDEDGELPF